MDTFVLVHSPLVGPMTWSLVADELRRRGYDVVTPALRQQEAGDEPYWSQHVRSVADAIRPVPPDRAVILVGHSGAGPLLPAIRNAVERPVAAYVFVDAGLPANGETRLGAGPFAQALREIYQQGERFPNWQDEHLREVVPDITLQQRLLAELRPQPWRFWEEAIPVFPGWPDAPRAYLRFTPNPAYDTDAAEAQRLGWQYAEISGGHFHMLVDPAAVTETLLHLVRAGLKGDTSGRAL